jgi:hypothetical protein
MCNTRRPLQLTRQITTQLPFFCQSKQSAFFSSRTASHLTYLPSQLTRPTAKPGRRISRQPTDGPNIKRSCQAVYRADGLVFCTYTSLRNFYSIVMGWTINKSGFQSQHGQSYFSSPKRQDRLWGPLNFQPMGDEVNNIPGSSSPYFLVVWYLNFKKLAYTLCTNRFNIQKSYILPTLCIYVFCVDLRTTSDYFTVHH